MRYGKIEYEIRVNLDKRFPPTNNNGNFKGGGRGNFNRGNTNTSINGNYLIEKATLAFTDSVSLFITEEMESVNQQRQTYTTVTYSDLIQQQVITRINLLGEVFLIQDKQKEAVWKYTGKVREIAGIECPQVFTKLEDGTVIYAWFNTEVIPSIGPESYWNLPGAILGLAYEDGGITYFATQISSDYPEELNDFKMPSSKKIYTRTQFDKEFSTKYEATNRYYQLIQDLLHFY